MERSQSRAGDLSWRLSSHPITLLFFLGFRISSLFIYLFGSIFITNFILVFILTILLLAADFYYLKNIAGRRLVGLRWWNEVDTASGDSHWVFESQDRSGSVESGAPTQNATDKRFFWLALYAQPALWVALAIVSVVRLQNPIWLSLVGLDNGLLGHLEVWFIAFPNPQPLPSQSKRCTSFGDLFDHPEQNTAFLDKQITKALCILTPSISSVSCNSIRPMEQGTCNEASGSKAGEFITAVGDLPQAVILQMEVKGS
ncbi:MAG: hypothetical protein LQ338_007327 [Usnochroma carphineum]|nr:MAG: hypothetical protein LQ338_007327 [Usnochroma carphineum]